MIDRCHSYGIAVFTVNAFIDINSLISSIELIATLPSMNATDRHYLVTMERGFAMFVVFKRGDTMNFRQSSKLLTTIGPLGSPVDGTSLFIASIALSTLFYEIGRS
ncbi:hypothetical protein BIS22_06320 [Lactiplantibacillus pentosus]|nr:hypothetical protein BIS22_06320 [Lactiplantibacillus pentosus]